MKEEGEEETKRLSVKIPVSTLLNSRRVWSPAIWPEEGRQGRVTPLQHTFTLCHANPIYANAQKKNYTYLYI